MRARTILILPVTVMLVLPPGVAAGPPSVELVAPETFSGRDDCSVAGPAGRGRESS
jgi:hypothetical protein